MGNKPTYRVALVSCAMHQPQQYAPTFAKHPRTEVVCVADDPNEIDDYVVETNKAMAELYGVPYIESIDAVAADPTIDIVSVCPQLERRGGVSARLADAGKHVFMDKPNAITVAEARAIADAARARNVRTVIYGRHLSTMMQRIGRELDAGSIGELKAIHWDLIFAKGQAGTVPDDWATAISQDLSRFTYRAHNADPSGSGHNVWAKRELHEIGLYPVGQVQHLADSPVRTVYAQLGQYWLGSHAERGLEDFAIVHMTFENGVTSTITTGRYGRETDPGSGVDKVSVIGTRGSIVADGSPPVAMTYGVAGDDGKGATRVDAADSSGIAALIDEFIVSIDEGRETINNAEHGVAQVETLLAGYASYFSGQPVSLPLA